MIETEFKYKRSGSVDDEFISLRKAKMIRRISLLFILLALLISACAPTSKISPTTLPPTITLIATLSAEIQATPTAVPTEAPTETSKFTIDSQKLPPEQAASMKAHVGLEASIQQEADGRYTTTMTVLTAEGQPTQQQAEVKPDTLHEDIASKNKYGNTPVMETVDGKKMYWVQEEKGWITIDRSADPGASIMVPYGSEAIPVRIEIVENNLPFSQAALERWKTKSGLSLSFQYLTVNANTGEGTKFGYMENRSLTDSDVTRDNTPMQIIDSWYKTILPDGTVISYFPTKWLDPVNPRDPKGDEWKIVLAAVGPEIMGDAINREKFDKLWNQAATPGSRLVVTPIFKAQEGFFNGTNNLITFGAAQPSLGRLIDRSASQFVNMSNPNLDGFTFSYWVDQTYAEISPSNIGYGIYFENNNPDYKDNFLPDEIQTIIFPSLIIQK